MLLHGPVCCGNLGVEGRYSGQQQLALASGWKCSLLCPHSPSSPVLAMQAWRRALSEMGLCYFPLYTWTSFLVLWEKHHPPKPSDDRHPFLCQISHLSGVSMRNYACFCSCPQQQTKNNKALLSILWLFWSTKNASDNRPEFSKGCPFGEPSYLATAGDHLRSKDFKMSDEQWACSKPSFFLGGSSRMTWKYIIISSTAFVILSPLHPPPAPAEANRCFCQCCEQVLFPLKSIFQHT